MRVRLEPAVQTGTYELALVTARSGTTLTVTRGQEGTTAAAWSAGDRVSFPITAGSLTAIASASVDVAYILARDHGVLDPTGVTDNAAILRSCYTTALAALTNGAQSARIVFPTGTFLFSTAASNSGGSTPAALALRANHTGVISLEGQGVNATTFKLSQATTPALVGWYAPDVAVSAVFGNVTFRDFTVDANTSSATILGGTLLDIAGPGLNIYRIYGERVNVTNYGPATNNYTGPRAAVNLASNATTWNPPTQYYIKDIKFRHCRFGRINGVGTGAITGFQCQGFNSAEGGALQSDAVILAGGFNANTWIDGIVLEDVHWDSGLTSFNGIAATVSPGAGVMLGKGAIMGRVRITDCTVRGSFDVGYEVDSVYDCVITRSTSEDVFNSHFYYRPDGGLPEVDAPADASTLATERSQYTLVDCRARNNVMAGSGTSGSKASLPVGFFLHAKDFGIPAGHVKIRNFNYIVDGADGLRPASNLFAKVVGGFRSVDIDGVNFSARNFVRTTGGTVRGLFVSLRTGRGLFRIRNLVFTCSGSINLASGNVTHTTLQIDNIADYAVDVEGVRSRHYITTLGGTGKWNPTEVNLLANNSSLENFVSTTTFTQGWRNDLTGSSQALSDFSVASNTLSPSANMGVEHRLTQVKNESDTVNFDYGQVGPTTDHCAWVQCTPPTTPTSAYKQGIRLKIDASTGGQSVHCYVAYNGTNYTVNVDTEVAGSLTNRASTVIGASVTSPFYVRAMMIGNVITADYLTAVPTTPVAPTATTTATYTVTSGDGTLSVFGGGAAQGWPGLVWTPVDAGSTAQNLTHYFLSVIAGRIAQCGPIEAVGTNNYIMLGNPSIASTTSTWGRFRKVLEMPEWDLTALTVILNTVTTNQITDVLTKQFLRATRWTYLTPPAAAAITPSASPYTYTNQDGYDEDVAIYGGTVSVISVTRVGGSASQVADGTGRVLRISPGESVTVTYSLVPVMRKTPVS